MKNKDEDYSLIHAYAEHRAIALNPPKDITVAFFADGSISVITGILCTRPHNPLIKTHTYKLVEKEGNHDKG